MSYPVIIFAYNRPKHLQNLIKSLLINKEFITAPKYFFIDGPKSSADKEQVQKSISVIQDHDFHNVIMKINETNKGLAQSIIDGVTEVLKEHEAVIVLEDDLIVGKYYLKYMNDTLNFYADSDINVAQVSGFIFPVKQALSNTAFLLPLTSTLGWGTWRNVWNEVNFYPTDYNILEKDKTLRKSFDLDNAYPYTKMLKTQMTNENFGSWGIRFWWDVFKRKQLVVYPDYPMAQHNDFDLTGTHKSDYSHLDMENWNTEYQIFNYTNSNNNVVYELLKKHLKKRFSWANKLKYRLKRLNRENL